MIQIDNCHSHRNISNNIRFPWFPYEITWHTILTIPDIVADKCWLCWRPSALAARHVRGLIGHATHHQATGVQEREQDQRKPGRTMVLLWIDSHWMNTFNIMGYCIVGSQWNNFWKNRTRSMFELKSRVIETEMIFYIRSKSNMADRSLINFLLIFPWHILVFFHGKHYLCQISMSHLNIRCSEVSCFQS